MDEEAFRKNFGHALRAAREGAGLSQRELAERAQIADKYLSRVELGASSVSLYVAHALTHALGIGIDTLTLPGRDDGPSAAAAVAELLRGRSPEVVARALRVLRALEDPSEAAPSTRS